MASEAPAVASSMAASPPLQTTRLVGVGVVVFLANAALLVLQLVASRLLAPFCGSSLETWTSIIGVFLAGIALGNAIGGKLADRYPSPRTLAALLAVGAVAALWMAIFPELLSVSGLYKSIPLGPRIPILALVLCLPAGLALSLLTPLAIKLGVPDVSKTGRVVGMVFALSTLGCILGNYLTGFVLIPAFYINTLVYFTAGSLALLSFGSMVVLGQAPTEEPSPEGAEEPEGRPAAGETSADATTANPYAFTDIRLAFAIVFLASFSGMTLELTASRVLAQFLGVSLFTWTGIIGVMLAGTAFGNFTGGVIADRVNRSSEVNPRHALAASLLLAGGTTVFQFVAQALVSRYAHLDDAAPIIQVVWWTFCIFFLPMYALGTISPQVIRLAVPDMAHVGRVAGRVYAWSTTGAIVGTFLTGYVLISTIGTNNTILAMSLLLALTSLLAGKVWSCNPLLYAFSIVLGGVTGGLILMYRADARDDDMIAKLETNYYTIKVKWEKRGYEDPLTGEYQMTRTGRKNLTLDFLIHSCVDPTNPFFLHYTHEHVQMEFVRLARTETPTPRVLVIGGGGYTFPRYAMESLPETQIDVVEIDPGVTYMAKTNLGLKDYDGLTIHHRDGRQFVAEKAPKGSYDLVVLDAVNDLSVPAHLLTKEYNDAVKAALKPGGAYLLTVIDCVAYGKLWKAAMHTLGETFPPENIALLAPDSPYLDTRQVYVIYASDRPLDLDGIEAAVAARFESQAPGITAVAGGIAAAATTCHPARTRQVTPSALQQYLDAPPRIVLTDQYAPVDNLMADVFRYRYRNPPKE